MVIFKSRREKLAPPEWTLPDRIRPLSDIEWRELRARAELQLSIDKLRKRQSDPKMVILANGGNPWADQDSKDIAERRSA